MRPYQVRQYILGLHLKKPEVLVHEEKEHVHEDEKAHAEHEHHHHEEKDDKVVVEEKH